MCCSYISAFFAFLHQFWVLETELFQLLKLGQLYSLQGVPPCSLQPYQVLILWEIMTRLRSKGLNLQRLVITWLTLIESQLIKVAFVVIVVVVVVEVIVVVRVVVFVAVDVLGLVVVVVVVDPRNLILKFGQNYVSNSW